MEKGWSDRAASVSLQDGKDDRLRSGHLDRLAVRQHSAEGQTVDYTHRSSSSQASAHALETLPGFNRQKGLSALLAAKDSTDHRALTSSSGAPYDPSEYGAPTVLNEDKRLETINALGLGESPLAIPSAEIDLLLALACDILGVDSAGLTFIQDREIAVTNTVPEKDGGVQTGQYTWQNSMCPWLLMTPKPTAMIVERLMDDARFAHLPWSSAVFSYASAPLVASNGQRLGSFCVNSSQPNKCSAARVCMINNIAELLVRELEKHYDVPARLNKGDTRLQAAYKRRIRPLSALSSCLALVDVETPGMPILYVNSEFEGMTGHTRGKLIHSSLQNLLCPVEDAPASSLLDSCSLLPKPAPVHSTWDDIKAAASNGRCYVAVLQLGSTPDVAAEPPSQSRSTPLQALAARRPSTRGASRLGVASLSGKALISTKTVAQPVAEEEQLGVVLDVVDPAETTFASGLPTATVAACDVLGYAASPDSMERLSPNTTAVATAIISTSIGAQASAGAPAPASFPAALPAAGKAGKAPKTAMQRFSKVMAKLGLMSSSHKTRKSGGPGIFGYKLDDTLAGFPETGDASIAPTASTSSTSSAQPSTIAAGSTTSASLPQRPLPSSIGGCCAVPVVTAAAPAIARATETTPPTFNMSPITPATIGAFTSSASSLPVLPLSGAAVSSHATSSSAAAGMGSNYPSLPALSLNVRSSLSRTTSLLGPRMFSVSFRPAFSEVVDDSSVRIGVPVTAPPAAEEDAVELRRYCFVRLVPSGGHGSCTPSHSQLVDGPCTPSAHPRTPRAAAGQPCSLEEVADMMPGLSLHQVLGHGAYGTVYAGRWHGMDVAAKVQDFLVKQTRPAQYAGAEDESNLGRRLQHPNVVHTYTHTVLALPSIIKPLRSAMHKDMMMGHNHSNSHHKVSITSTSPHTSGPHKSPAQPSSPHHSNTITPTSQTSLCTSTSHLSAAPLGAQSPTFAQQPDLHPGAPARGVSSNLSGPHPQVQPPGQQHLLASAAVMVGGGNGTSWRRASENSDNSFGYRSDNDDDFDGDGGYDDMFTAFEEGEAEAEQAEADFQRTQQLPNMLDTHGTMDSCTSASHLSSSLASGFHFDQDAHPAAPAAATPANRSRLSMEQPSSTPSKHASGMRTSTSGPLSSLVDTHHNRSSLATGLLERGSFGSSFTTKPDLRILTLQELCPYGTMQHATDVGFFRNGIEASSGINMRLVLQTMLGICNGLAYLHDQGVVHADLSAHNVLLGVPADFSAGLVDELVYNRCSKSGAGRTADRRVPIFIPKISDFGKARKLALGDVEMHTGTLPTITHIPAETMLEGTISKAADVYAVGIIFWQALTGSRPWAGLRATDIIKAVARDGRTLQFTDDIPQHIQVLVSQCWLPAPQRPTAEELAAKVEVFLKELCTGGFMTAHGDM